MFQQAIRMFSSSTAQIDFISVPFPVLSFADSIRVGSVIHSIEELQLKVAELSFIPVSNQIALCSPGIKLDARNTLGSYGLPSEVVRLHS